jgi:predicted nucleic acid-binding protein
MIPYIVVDASVAGAWSYNEPFSAAAARVLDAIVGRRVIALAPDRFEEEFLSICRKKVRPPNEGGLSLPAADCWSRFEDVLTAPMPLYLVPARELHQRAWQLSLSVSRLTIHDALYLALAERWEAELWTLDDVLGGPAAATYAVVRDLRQHAFSY